MKKGHDRKASEPLVVTALIVMIHPSTRGSLRLQANVGLAIML